MGLVGTGWDWWGLVGLVGTGGAWLGLVGAGGAEDSLVTLQEDGGACWDDPNVSSILPMSITVSLS